MRISGFLEETEVKRKLIRNEAKVANSKTGYQVVVPEELKRDTLLGWL